MYYNYNNEIDTNMIGEKNTSYEHQQAKEYNKQLKKENDLLINKSKERLETEKIKRENEYLKKVNESMKKEIREKSEGKINKASSKNLPSLSQ